MSRIRQSPRATAPLVAAAIAGLVALAWSQRFVQDDAFISFRYAENLVAGNGLVWNPGERVEGYTNFLWTLLMAAGLRLGAPIAAWATALGLASFAGSLTLVFALARRVLGSTGWAALALLVVGTNYSFIAYATGGLETSLQTGLVWLALFSADRALAQPHPRDLTVFSLAAAAALLTRLDSALLLAVPALALARPALRAPARVLPGIAVLGAWLVWKAAYYGALLPLTFTAKQGGDRLATLEQGVFYLATWASSYWLVPVALMIAAFAWPLLRDARTRPFASGLALWCAYALWFGGDFMEFRWMTPVWPAFALCALWVPARWVARPRARVAAAVAVAALALAGSWHHARTFLGAGGIESVASLSGHLSADGWERAGIVLREAFPDPGAGPTIATTAAGAIPFHSRLRTIDMLGLNDPWIARHGLPVRTQPGHERTAPLAYLLERGVQLVIAHPVVVPQDAWLGLARGLDPRLFRIFDATPEDLPSGARAVEIPLGDGRKLVALALLPSAAVDAAIARYGWKTTAIRAARGPLPAR